MALITMITMNACSKVNKDTANDVCKALEEKYGEPFESVKIGDRFNTNSAKLYIHPVHNKEMLFVAKINKETGIVEDNYVEEKVYHQVEGVIAESFEKNGISVAARCLIVSGEILSDEVGEFTPSTFKDKYQFDHYTIYLIIEEGNFDYINKFYYYKISIIRKFQKLLVLMFIT